MRAFMTISEHVLKILEWDSILKELELRCETSIGKSIIPAINPLPDEKIKSQLKLISELKEMMLQYEAMDFTGVLDIKPLAELTVKEGVLDTGDLCRVRDFIRASNRIISFMARNRAKLKNVFEEFNTLNKLSALGELLNTSLTDTGEININKYPELKSIKDSLFNVKQEIEKRLGDILHSQALSAAIQEKIHTIRNERYVILVKANMRDKVKGNFHDVSSTGATIYIEPDEITGLNNKMIMLERDYKNEIFKILRDLSKETAKHADELIYNQALLAKLDFLAAASKFSISLKASEPEISSEMIINLYSARHPLLYLMSTDSVIANDISIGKNFNCMIISGANTGGKTVLLKTVGLCSLLAMHGLHIPAGPDSSIGIFSGILADIGDDQSIFQSLSTFSGQIVVINDMIQNANKNTLVLIDEILAGTNPRQGAVLAEAVLEKLAETGAIVIAATHYPELKELAVKNEKFENASVSFDVETLKPTYKLRTGIPGTSYTLDIAQIYGMRNDIISRAKELLNSREITTEALIENIQKHKEETEEERRKIIETNNQLTNEKNKYMEMQSRLNQKIEEIKNERGIDFIDEINRYRKEITERIKGIKNEGEKELEKINQELSQTREKVYARLKKDRKKRFLNKHKTFDPAKAKPGDAVFIASLEKTGRIDTIDIANKKASVILGSSIKSKFKFDDILTPVAKSKKPKRTENVPGNTPEHENSNDSGDIPRVLQTQYNTIDLRGLKVDEALAKLENDLDRMMRNRINTAVVIHGHGTGALKQAVRAQLRLSHYAKRSRAGEYGEGGDGVTVVSL
ncbi:MAG: endonuclease MutS2 [Spirochaetes bacterium]|nr:endonuclease MutS2 [Spirochaetota bacterium]